MPAYDDVKAITFESVNWTKPDEIIQLFPDYIQEKIKIQGVKGISNTVDIAPFHLETPFKDKVLLTKSHLHLEPYKRHCLFGANGTGKTLLFERMVDHSIEGFPPHLHVHHLKEMEHSEVAETVLETVVHSHEFLGIIRRCDKKVKTLIAAGNEEEKAALEDTVLMIEQYMRQLESDYAEDKASKMLRALGFDEHGMSTNTNNLSGGLRMRVALAVAFFADADLLLLDEPTNHLDFPSVLWLENRLRGYSKSFLLVTHDRDLLCNVTTSTLLLEEKKINYYPCGFGEFEKRKAKEDAKRDKETERFLKINHNVDPSTMAGRRAYDMRAWQTRYHERLVLLQGKFTFPKATPLKKGIGEEVNEDGSTTLMKLTDVRFSYSVEKGLPYIFDDPISFTVTTKSRIGIMGPNGAGKSTLLKLLTKKIIPTEGKQYEHPDFVLAYFGQHSTAELVMTQTPMEFMAESFPDAGPGKTREHLKKTGVSNGVESTRMENLSYSQRSCVIFSKLTFICPHLLIMDEPTNFLDIESVDSLVNAANKFPGALLVVTHSRGFLRKCAKTFLSVVPGQFLPFSNIKDAEESTYTFMQHMESGNKIDAGVLAAGGGSLHSKKEATVDTKFKVGEEVMALWTDKKWYKGVVSAIPVTEPKPKYSVTYPEFNKRATLPEAGLKKIDKDAEKAAVVAAAETAEQKKKSAASAARKAKKQVWTVGEKCLAPSKDGRMFAASVTQVLPFDMLMIEFDSIPGQEKKMDKQNVRPFDAALATPGSAAGGAKGGKGAGGGGKGKGAGGKGAKGGKGKGGKGKGR